VEQNGGVIEVKSEVGKGTAFTVKLPNENRR
jgi:chemotaxis protein histidine kinase CheA